MKRSDDEIITVIIPAWNEQDNIGLVIGELPEAFRGRVIVVDNASDDDTARVAQAAGARVAREDVRGYGSACLRGLSEAAGSDIVVFVDGDLSDYPEEAADLVAKLREGYDMVVGSRMIGKRERGALPPHSVFGNWLVCALMNIFAGTRHTDLGPFRAVRYEKLMRLGMKDANYGWTVEMALRAAGAGWRVTEIPVRYRKRNAGKSKITGSVVASAKTAYKMLYVLARITIEIRRERRSK